jgi:hypothetical protein
MDNTTIADILSKIDNISSDDILKTSIKDNENINRTVLKSIGIENDKCNEILDKLYGYKLINTIDDLNYGLFTRVVKLNNIKTLDDITVKNVGIVVNCYDVYSSKHKRTRVMIKCKLGRLFNNVVFEECFLFQKMKTDDLIVMSLVDYLREA